jgi:hypothetical protein
LGPRLAQSLALQGAFGAWGRVLGLVTSAAKRVDDATTLHAARHDCGVRALLLGEHRKAQTFLQSAVTDRERIGDHAGAAASADVLARVSDLLAVPELPMGQSLPPARDPALERNLPPEPNQAAERNPAPNRHPAPPPGFRPNPATARRRTPEPKPRREPALPRRTSTSFLVSGSARIRQTVTFAGLALAAIALLGLVFWRPQAAPAIAEFSTDHAAIDSGSSARLCVTAIGATLLAIAPGIGALPAHGKHCVNVAPMLTTTYTAVATGPAGQEVHGSVTIAVNNEPRRPLQIQAFAARPDRIQAGQSTHLCYAVSGADLLRIVPRVGNLMRLRSCQTVTLTEPHGYTYQLFAFGRDGQVAERRARIDVVAAAPVTTLAAEPAPNPPAKVALLQTRTLDVSTAQRRASETTASRNRVRLPDGRLARRAIYQFDATPAVVERGQAASLCVGVGRWARGDVTAIGRLEPGITRCYRVMPAATTVYRLHVALDKSVAYETVTVAVRSPAARDHDAAHAQHRL